MPKPSDYRLLLLLVLVIIVLDICSQARSQPQNHFPSVIPSTLF